MAKRQTDTDKWKKPFIRNLKVEYKLFWVYLLDDCDHAGVWHVDLDIAQIKLGVKIDLKEALNYLEGKIYPYNNGAKWFIPDFIEFQYGGMLNEANRVHKSVIEILVREKLWEKFSGGEILNQQVNKPLIVDAEKFPLKEENKGLASPLEGAIDIDKDKDIISNTNYKKGVKEKNAPAEIVYPFQTENFMNWWGKWNEYRKAIKKPYKTPLSEQAILNTISRFDEEFAISLIEKSISNGWQGLVFEKTKMEFEQYKQNGKSKNSYYFDTLTELANSRADPNRKSHF